MIEPAEIEETAAAGAVGELLGHFFDVDGGLLDVPLSARTLSVPLPLPGAGRVVAIAGGPEKVLAVTAILRSRRLAGLVTDERTAKAILQEG